MASRPQLHRKKPEDRSLRRWWWWFRLQSRWGSHAQPQERYRNLGSRRSFRMHKKPPKEPCVQKTLYVCVCSFIASMKTTNDPKRLCWELGVGGLAAVHADLQCSFTRSDYANAIVLGQKGEGDGGVPIQRYSPAASEAHKIYHLKRNGFFVSFANTSICP